MKVGRVALKPGKKRNICSKKEEQNTEAMESVTKSEKSVGWAEGN